MMKELSKTRIFWILFVIILIAPIFSNFYKYYYKKDYDYLIEVKCDPLHENCFTRDCSNADDCPPNGLSNYKEFYVKAYDFAKCKSNSCEDECKTGTVKCTPIKCGDSQDDTCTNNNL